MNIYSIKYGDNPRKPKMPYGSKLCFHDEEYLPFDLIDVSALADIDGMFCFFRQSSFKTLPQLTDTSKFKDWLACFQDCTILTAIPEIDTSGGYAFDNMFEQCLDLVTIPRLNVSGADDSTSLIDIFLDCEALTTIGWEGVIPHSLSIAESPLLDDATILRTAYCLSTSDEAHTLTLNSALSDKADEYVKENEAGDGLVFCESTDPDTLGTLADYCTAKNWTIAFV